jgi:hypothetical protein
LFWVLDQVNLALQLVRIAYWLRLLRRYLRCVMQPVRARSFTVAKVIYESVLLLLNVYLVFVTLFLLAPL